MFSDRNQHILCALWAPYPVVAEVHHLIRRNLVAALWAGRRWIEAELSS
jgi:hypothetical protein